MVLISILQIFRSWVATSHLRPPMAFLSHNSSDTPGLAPVMDVLFWGRCDISISFSSRVYKGTFVIVSKEVLWSVRGSYKKTIWNPPLPNVTRHSGWWPYTVTSSIEIGHFINFWPCNWSWPYYWIYFLPNCARFPQNICIVCGMSTEDAYSSGHLRLGTCNCSDVETNPSWTCLVSGLLSSLGTSGLLHVDYFHYSDVRLQ